MFHLLSSLGAILLGIMLPQFTLAQVGGLSGVVDSIAGGTPLSLGLPVPAISCPPNAGVGSCAFASLLVYATQRGRALAASLAIVVVVIAGFRLIVKQSEESFSQMRRSLLGATIGLFLFFIAEPFVDAIYGGFSLPAGGVLDNPGNVTGGALIISEELFGFMRWGETFVAAMAVGLLCAQAVRVLGSFGSEELIRKAYRSVFYTVLGLLLLVFDQIFARMFGFRGVAFPGSPNATIFIVEAFGLVRLLLGFVGIAVIGVIIYAGFLMILNFGNDQLLTKGKDILLHAILGLALIVVSFLIVHVMVLGLS